MVGCRVRKALPKHEENVACGSVTPRSVPASLAVYPLRKWYSVCSLVRIETGGRIPKASAVRKITFLGCVPLETGLTIRSM